MRRTRVRRRTGRRLTGYAALTGSGFALTAREFEVVYANARYGGDDEASLTDSSGDDVFVATTDDGKINGDNYSVRVKRFESVHAYSRNGGTDRARITGSASADSVTSPQSTLDSLQARRWSGRSSSTKSTCSAAVGATGRICSIRQATTARRVPTTCRSRAPDTPTRFGASPRSPPPASAEQQHGGLPRLGRRDAFFADGIEARMSGAGYDNQHEASRASRPGQAAATIRPRYSTPHWPTILRSATWPGSRSSALVTWVYDFDQLQA